MTYSVLEPSAQSGAPVELYEFRLGPTFFRYTSADVDQVYQSKTFEARPLNRGLIEHTAEKARTSLKIDAAKDLPMLDLFRYQPPGDVVTLTIYRMHRGDTDAVVFWMGRVLNVTWNRASATIYCEPVYTSLKRPGLRRHDQRNCPHVLYSGPCGLSSATYRQIATVQAISGLQLTLQGISGADGYFAGGYVEWEYDTGLYERRAIADHTGAVVTLSFVIAGIDAGATINVYPGCDHGLSTCSAKFSNSLNYGGFPYIPQKNPFDGTPVY